MLVNAAPAADRTPHGQNFVFVEFLDPVIEDDVDLAFPDIRNDVLVLQGLLTKVCLQHQVSCGRVGSVQISSLLQGACRHWSCHRAKKKPQALLVVAARDAVHSLSTIETDRSKIVCQNPSLNFTTNSRNQTWRGGRAAGVDPRAGS